MTWSDDINDFCFYDTETKARDGTPPPHDNVVTAGTYAYADHAFVIIFTYAIGDGPVHKVCMDEGWEPSGMWWRDMPDDLRAFHERVEKGEAWYCAFNAGFDRTVWYRSTYDFPYMKPEHTIDMMTQAIASNLPPSLDGVAMVLGLGGKQKDGKALIKLFCSPDGATPQSHPEEWEHFKSYGRLDTEILRKAWKMTRRLPYAEWQEYWASEHINERGIPIDLPFIEKCDAISVANIARSNKRLKELTGGVVTKVTQRERIANWVYDRLEHAEAREMMVKEYDDSEEDDIKVTKIGIARDRIEAMLAFFENLNEKQGLTDEEVELIEILEIRQWDGSSSPMKFSKMLAQHSDELLQGSYVFNGAAQTGRYSSKGVQVHNMGNKAIGLEQGNMELEIEAIEMINELERIDD